MLALQGVDADLPKGWGQGNYCDNAELDVQSAEIEG